MIRPRHQLSVAILCAAIGPADGQVFKCIDPNGATTYQQTPCRSGQKGGPLEVRTDNGSSNDGAAAESEWAAAVQQHAPKSGHAATAGRAGARAAAGNPGAAAGRARFGGLDLRTPRGHAAHRAPGRPRRRDARRRHAERSRRRATCRRRTRRRRSKASRPPPGLRVHRGQGGRVRAPRWPFPAGRRSPSATCCRGRSLRSRRPGAAWRARAAAAPAPSGRRRTSSDTRDRREHRGPSCGPGCRTRAGRDARPGARKAGRGHGGRRCGGGLRQGKGGTERQDGGQVAKIAHVGSPGKSGHFSRPRSRSRTAPAPVSATSRP